MDDGSWACSVCTFINSSSSSFGSAEAEAEAVCEMCGTRRMQASTSQQEYELSAAIAASLALSSSSISKSTVEVTYIKCVQCHRSLSAELYSGSQLKKMRKKKKEKEMHKPKCKECVAMSTKMKMGNHKSLQAICPQLWKQHGI